MKEGGERCGNAARTALGGPGAGEEKTRKITADC